MADNVEIRGLEFQIQEDSAGAVEGLDALRNSLSRLKTATSGSVNGLSQTSKGIKELSNALKGLNSGDMSQKITRIANSLKTLKDLGNLKLSSSIPNQLNALSVSLSKISWTDGDKLVALANGLKPLSE